MTLRIMLVGLVASLGFELPSDRDLSRWSDSGRSWIVARLAELPGPRIELDQPVAEAARPPAAEAPVADGDRTFELASEAMASDFAADLLASRDDAPKLDDALTTDGIATVAEVGLPAGEEPAIQDAPAVEVVASANVDADVEEDETVEEGEVAAPSVDRLTNAVRQTCEAVQAWAELIHESPEGAEPTH